jgi:hypothetical protein
MWRHGWPSSAPSARAFRVNSPILQLAGQEYGALVDIDAPALLALGLPKLEPLGPQGFPGFESEGEEALEWWQRLRAVSDRNGRWPLLLDHHTGALNAGFSKWVVDLGQLAVPL